MSSLAEESTVMFRDLADVFWKALPREYINFGYDDWPKLLEHADFGFEIDKALEVVVSILRYLEQSSPAALVAATKLLADGSRDGTLLMNAQ